MDYKILSYKWTHGVVYTIKWTLIITTIFVLIIYVIMHPDKISFKGLLVLILETNMLMVPIITLAIGLRPILGLRTRLNTFYTHKNNELFVDGIKINIDDIEQIDIKEIGLGQSHMNYYEISLKSLPAELKHRLRKRSTLICTDKYDILCLFKTKMTLIEELSNRGLSPDSIKYIYGSMKNIFGFRDKFKK